MEDIPKTPNSELKKYLLENLQETNLLTRENTSEKLKELQKEVAHELAQQIWQDPVLQKTLEDIKSAIENLWKQGQHRLLSAKETKPTQSEEMLADTMAWNTVIAQGLDANTRKDPYIRKQVVRLTEHYKNFYARQPKHPTDCNSSGVNMVDIQKLLEVIADAIDENFEARVFRKLRYTPGSDYRLVDDSTNLPIPDEISRITLYGHHLDNLTVLVDGKDEYLLLPNIEFHPHLDLSLSNSFTMTDYIYFVAYRLLHKLANPLIALGYLYGPHSGKFAEPQLEMYDYFTEISEVLSWIKTLNNKFEDTTYNLIRMLVYNNLATTSWLTSVLVFLGYISPESELAKATFNKGNSQRHKSSQEDSYSQTVPNWMLQERDPVPTNSDTIKNEKILTISGHNPKIPYLKIANDRSHYRPVQVSNQPGKSQFKFPRQPTSQNTLVLPWHEELSIRQINVYIAGTSSPLEINTVKLTPNKDSIKLELEPKSSVQSVDVEVAATKSESQETTEASRGNLDELDATALERVLTKIREELPNLSIPPRRQISTLLDLENFVRRLATYSYDKDFQFDENASRLSAFQNMIGHNGKLNYQCDGAAYFTKLILDEYFEQAELGLSARVRTVIVTQSSTVTSDYLHAIVEIADENGHIVKELDTTPTNLFAAINSKLRTLGKQIKKLFNKYNDPAQDKEETAQEVPEPSPLSDEDIAQSLYSITTELENKKTEILETMQNEYKRYGNKSKNFISETLQLVTKLITFIEKPNSISSNEITSVIKKIDWKLGTLNQLSLKNVKSMPKAEQMFALNAHLTEQIKELLTELKKNYNLLLQNLEQQEP